jgi:hypothetical protein
MYCSLDEAWPQLNINKYKQNNQYSQSSNKSNLLNNHDYEHFNEFMDGKNKNETTREHNIDCNIVMNHIAGCDNCLQELYKKYSFVRCIDSNGVDQNTLINFFKDLSNNVIKIVGKENKDIVSSILCGLLIILVLFYLKN